MFSIDLKSRKSIYEQIIDGFKEEIVSGKLLRDEKLPSVRELSSALTVNPNTIQKAYRTLEQQGWIYSVTGRGNFVNGDIPESNSAELAVVYQNIASLIKQLKFMGVKEEEILKEVKRLLDERRDAE